MLVEFSVANFRSIKDKITLSMQATGLKDKPDNVFEENGLDLLKTAAIYGPNASGKSNLILALNGFTRFLSVTNNDVSNLIGLHQPFLLSDETPKKPSAFESVFIYNSYLYEYSFSLTKEKILTEKLTSKKGKEKKITLFERHEQKIEIHNSMQDASIIIERNLVRQNRLFLHTAFQFNIAAIENVINGINSLRPITGLKDDYLWNFTLKKLKDNSYKSKIMQFLRFFDLGFNGLDVRYIKSPDKMTLELENQQELQLDLPAEIPLIYSVHSYKSEEAVFEKNVLLPIDHESDGTLRMIALSAPLIDTLENGYTLIVDEFDARFHPQITRKIIEMFDSPITNPRNAQLIVVSHDTYLMRKQILRRDQVWFTEKKEDNATDLFSLAEFPSNKVRKTSDFEKNYRLGRYGAIPNTRQILTGFVD